MRVVGAADSSGAAYAENGLDPAAILALKQQRQGVAGLPGSGRHGVSGLDLARRGGYDILLEATPTNLRDGQPGLDIVRAALSGGRHAVLASKGPLVLAYAELEALSDLAPQAGAGRPSLRFSGAVGGAVPTINLGRRDLAAARIRRVEAMLNGTTQLILSLMAEGQSYAAALAEAQRIGIAEPDPALDVEGWDAANKLVILANAVLRQPTTLADLQVTGIGGVTVEELRAARAAGGRVSLLAVAEPATTEGSPYRLWVRPVALAADHPLARLGPTEMGVVYDTDIYGRSVAISAEQSAGPTAAAMLRDVLEIVQ
jgi:homoserine dehydrogenase